MALIISSTGNTAFRSEEIVGISHLPNAKTGKLSKSVRIVFKSGRDAFIDCKTVKEAKEIKDKIIEILKQEY